MSSHSVTGAVGEVELYGGAEEAPQLAKDWGVLVLLLIAECSGGACVDDLSYKSVQFNETCEG